MTPMRKAVKILSLIVAGLVLLIAVAWFARAALSPSPSARPALAVLVNRTGGVTVLRGTPLVFSVSLTGRGNDVLKIGSAGHPWYDDIRLGRPDTGERIAWRVVRLGSPHSIHSARGANGRVTLEESHADQAVVAEGNVHTIELAIDPAEASNIAPGQYRFDAVLETPFRRPWAWHGRARSGPVVVTVVDPAQAGASAAGLERQRVTDSAALYLRMQRFEDARRLALDLLRQDPHSAQGYVFLGDALNGLHQDGPAYDAYLLALQWTPHVAGAEPPAYLLDRMSELDDRASHR